MKKILLLVFVFLGLSFFQKTEAANYSHIITLKQGWNLVSTPRIVESHQFSAPENLTNFSIYLQSSSSSSGWKTMFEVGQTEFTPLYGYFIYNNTGVNQTLTLNYKQNNTPAERMFTRSLSVGWNVLGIANPSYALKQKDDFSLDNNNVQNILNSISSSVSTVLDLTATTTNKSNVEISKNWNQKVFSEANQLDDFRETKAYAVYLNSVGNYDGFQNDDEVIVDEEPISTSTILISKKSTSPSDTIIARGVGGVTALIANIKVDENIVSDGFNLTYATSSADQFENVRVYVNGVLFDSFNLATSTEYITINSNLYLNKGDNEIKITVDTKDFATSGSSVNFVLSNNDLLNGMNPEYASSGNTVTSDKISGDAVGSVITVGAATLTTTRSDGYGDNRTIIQNTSDVSLGKFTVKAEYDSITIRSVSFAANTGTASSTFIGDMKLYIDGTQVGSTKDFTSSGVTFSSLSSNIPKDVTKQIEIKGSFDSNATGTFQTLMTIDARDSNGSSVSEGTLSATTTNFVIQEKGVAVVTKDSNSPESTILASKVGIEQSVASFRLTAVNDNINVRSLSVANASTTDVRIASYKLYNSTGSLLSTASPFDGMTEFTIASNALRVSTSTAETITIKVVLNNIENDSTATDKQLALVAEEIEFQDSSGSNNISDISVAANTFYIRKTVPTVALMTLPNTTLTSGTQVISKFTVTADSNADVKIGRLAVKYFATASTSLATTSSPIKINGTSKSTNVTSSITGTTTGYIYVDFGTTTPEIVSAGTSKTFEIVTNVTVDGSNRESLSTTIEEATAHVDGGTALVSGSLTWSDSASNIDANNIWFNSFRVKGLPTDTQTLSIN